MRGIVRPGNSGGPGIDPEGRVRTTVFARRPGDEGGFGVPADLVRAAVRNAGAEPLGSTACVR